MAETPSPTTPGETTAATEHASSGLPQFDTTQWPGQMVWFVVIFAALLFLMSRVFVPRIGGGIEGRESKISGDLDEARRLKAEAEAQAKEAAAQIAQARSAARSVALEARTKAQSKMAGRLADEEAKLTATMAEAEARIAAARDQAMGNVREIATEAAQAIVEKLTGRAATIAELRALEGLK